MSDSETAANNVVFIINAIEWFWTADSPSLLRVRLVDHTVLSVDVVSGPSERAVCGRIDLMVYWSHWWFWESVSIKTCWF